MTALDAAAIHYVAQIKSACVHAGDLETVRLTRGEPYLRILSGITLPTEGGEVLESVQVVTRMYR